MNISLQINALSTCLLINGRARKITKTAVIGTLLSLAAACSSTPVIDDSPAIAPPVTPIASRPDGSVRVDTESQEVARLWAAAEQARGRNQNSIALELLYEALEIDAQNSLLWSRAAEFKLDEVEPALAEDFATRSNAYAGDNNALLHRNWLIIEHSRSMRGDLLGVRDARNQAQIYQYR